MLSYLLEGNYGILCSFDSLLGVDPVTCNIDAIFLPNCEALVQNICRATFPGRYKGALHFRPRRQVVFSVTA
jgi:hypothetical protein